jgi:signal transduction histidine kinase
VAASIAGLQVSSVNDKVNILLVDDQAARLLSYEAILRDLGQNLISAQSGVQALERLMKDDFAVVLLDVSMPGMDGFETAAMIHDHPRYERTPIIFVTGVHDSELDRLKGYKLGAVDYVSIPVVPEILRSKVAVLVELHCQRRELKKLNQSLAEANARLEAANITLQEEKTHELEQFNGHLQRANKDLAEINMALKAENCERLRAETALKEANQQKDEFLAILAHELRNPLAPIRSAVEIMHRDQANGERVLWARDLIGRQVTHLTRLVDDLLDISRITHGAIRLNKEPLQVGIVITRAIEAVQPFIEERAHQLHLDCPDATLLVDGDLTRLVQVLANLLNNAAKYTERGGRIQVTVHADGSMVAFRIKDNGIGIAPESVPKLFNLFSRVEPESATPHGGLGVGLALVRNLVDMHAGEVAIHSGGLHQGSEFVVRLPLLTGVVEQVKHAPLNGAVQESVTHRILLADDNADAMESLALLLELAGHEVRKASDGLEAVKVAAAWQPDLALLDIGMPGLDGYEVARHIRAQPWGEHMMVVALSGWGQSEDMRSSREAGFNLHLVKPISFEALDAVLAQVRPGAARAEA